MGWNLEYLQNQQSAAQQHWYQYHISLLSFAMNRIKSMKCILMPCHACTLSGCISAY